MIGAQLRACLAGVEERMADLEEQMTKLRTKMTLLKAEKQTIENDLGAIVCPKVSQHMIPTEIMSMIFMEVKHADDPRAVLDLFSVCSHWHNIVKNTCQLYTDLFCGQVDKLGTYAARAGTSLPLDLEFHLSSLSSTESQRLRDILLQHASQWATLTFFVSSWARLPSDLSADSFTRLTRLSLVSLSLAVAVDLPQLDAPRLQDLTLNCRSLGTGWQVQLRWAQITTLAVNDGISEWWEILAETPNLEQLYVSEDIKSDADDDDTPSIPILCLPRLRMLVFTGARDSRVRAGLLQYLTLPALETLKIPFRLLFADPLTLQPFFERSNCSIRILVVLMEFDHPPADAFDRSSNLSRVLLRYFSTVRKLTLQSATGEDMDMLFRCLGVPSSGFLPSLESLALLECRRRVPLYTVIEMLSARAGIADSASDEGTPSVKLTSFTLRYGAPGPASDDIARIVRNGLDVDIGSDFKWLDKDIDLKMIDVISRGEEDYDESDDEGLDEEPASGKEQDSGEEQESEHDSDSEDD
ncbi:hypothetical protein FB45DRAFT_1021353 [Roridomyces roridus]|uniref:F-box domain-containing protein n=1 Tax=Roridomyces roridus TaxID=1738132 RepID=A0AAD7CC23_9AGAR|nr:hypothetical protein FB45DRAFT_1021353 [Roridomyces roridus]